MKKVLITLAILCLMAGMAYATTMDTHVSGNAVLFRPIEWTIPSIGASTPTPTIVTFNSTTRHIWMMNLSNTTDCYAAFKCTNNNGKRGHIESANCVVLLPALGRATPNTVELDFATQNIGFVGGDTAPSNKFRQQVYYVVTGDTGDF